MEEENARLLASWRAVCTPAPTGTRWTPARFQAVLHQECQAGCQVCQEAFQGPWAWAQGTLGQELLCP